MERLTTLAPDVFGPKHLRTLQRAIAAERLVFARRLISEGVSSLLVTPPALTLAGIVMPTGDMEEEHGTLVYAVGNPRGVKVTPAFQPSKEVLAKQAQLTAEEAIT